MCPLGLSPGVWGCSGSAVWARLSLDNAVTATCTSAQLLLFRPAWTQQNNGSTFLHRVPVSSLSPWHESRGSRVEKELVLLMGLGHCAGANTVKPVFALKDLLPAFVFHFCLLIFRHCSIYIHIFWEGENCFTWTFQSWSFPYGLIFAIFQVQVTPPATARPSVWWHFAVRGDPKVFCKHWPSTASAVSFCPLEQLIGTLNLLWGVPNGSHALRLPGWCRTEISALWSKNQHYLFVLCSSLSLGLNSRSCCDKGQANTVSAWVAPRICSQKGEDGARAGGRLSGGLESTCWSSSKLIDHPVLAGLLLSSW